MSEDRLVDWYNDEIGTLRRVKEEVTVDYGATKAEIVAETLRRVLGMEQLEKIWEE